MSKNITKNTVISILTSGYKINDELSALFKIYEIIDKLISKGYVNRFICEKNRRKIEIFITEKGLSLLKSLDHVVDEKEKDLLSNITLKEKEELTRILLKIKTETNQ